MGKVGSGWCAYEYKYVLPQVSAYTVPSTIASPCRPKFSFLGKDTRGGTSAVLSGEYCNSGDAQCPYDGTTPGLGGRLYRWPLNASTNRLEGVGGAVVPERAWVMNEPNVQGVAPVDGHRGRQRRDEPGHGRTRGVLRGPGRRGLSSKTNKDTQPRGKCVE